MDEVVVIGVGNLSRRDDAVGILAARSLGAAIHGIRVIETSGDLLALLDAFQGFRSVYVVDAVSTPEPRPGFVHDFDAIRTPLPDSTLLSSSHVLGVCQAVELARAMGSLPSVLRVFGIEARDFGIGEGLSPEAALSLPDAVSRIFEVIRDEIRESGASP